MSTLFQPVLAGKVVSITSVTSSSAQPDVQAASARNTGSSLLVPVLRQGAAQLVAR